MKKFIFLTAVIVTACLQQLSAQPGTQVTDVVLNSFNREFKEATDVKWSKINELFQSRFYSKQEYSLAYFDADGRMILSGRKISIDIAPLPVKKELARIRNNSERQHDILAVAEVYELNDVAGTRYFINLDSETLSMSVMAYGNGRSEILKKANKKLEPAGNLSADHK